MEISSGDSTPTDEAACGGGGGLSDAAAPRLASLTAVSLSAALPRLLESAPDGDTPPAEDRGPPTPTLSEPIDTPDRRGDRECWGTGEVEAGGAEDGWRMRAEVQGGLRLTGRDVRDC